MLENIEKITEEYEIAKNEFAENREIFNSQLQHLTSDYRHESKEELGNNFYSYNDKNCKDAFDIAMNFYRQNTDLFNQAMSLRKLFPNTTNREIKKLIVSCLSKDGSNDKLSADIDLYFYLEKSGFNMLRLEKEKLSDHALKVFDVTTDFYVENKDRSSVLIKSKI